MAIYDYSRGPQTSTVTPVDRNLEDIDYGTRYADNARNPEPTYVDNSSVDGLFSDNPTLVNANQESTTTELQFKIENSQLYKSAYKLLSQDNNPIWVQRLQAIPASIVGANSTFLDDVGLSNKYNDKIQAIEAEAYSQIQRLIAEYHSYRQGLPATQVQQFSDAGINSAITGQGIEGASISGMSADKNLSPYSIDSADPLQGISTIGNLLFSSSNGILSAIQVFNQLRTNKETLAQSARSSHWNIQKDLMDLGFRSFPVSSSVEDFDSWWTSHGNQEAISLNLGNSAYKKLRQQLLDFSSVQASSRLTDLTDNGSTILSDAGQKIINQMVDFEIDTWLKTSEYKNALSNYNSLFQASLDPAKMAEYSMDKSEFDAGLAESQMHLRKLEEELSRGRNTAIKQWIETAGSDPQARAIIARTLMNISPLESVQLQEFSAFKGSAVANQVFNVPLSVLNTVK